MLMDGFFFLDQLPIPLLQSSCFKPSPLLSNLMAPSSRVPDEKTMVNLLILPTLLLCSGSSSQGQSLPTCPQFHSLPSPLGVDQPTVVGLCSQQTLEAALLRVISFFPPAGSRLFSPPLSRLSLGLSEAAASVFSLSPSLSPLILSLLCFVTASRVEGLLVHSAFRAVCFPGILPCCELLSL